MILNKDFFKNGEVIFVGYSSRNPAYSKLIYKTFSDNGIRVYAVNTRKNASFDVKVYGSLDELPVIPECAFVLLKSENTREAVKQLGEKGVKRILFRSGKTVDDKTLEECRQKGIETALGCPMMVFGSGIHRLHGFFSGVKK